MFLTSVLLALALSNCYISLVEMKVHTLGDKLSLAEDGKSVEIVVASDFTLQIFLGESFVGRAVEFRDDPNFIEVGYDGNVALRIDLSMEESINFYKFRWMLPPPDLEYLKDTFYLADSQWYGGAFTRTQKWPLDTNGGVYPMTPYILHDLFKTPVSGQERYWLNANNVALHVPDYVPLWTERDKAYLKLQAQIARSPYSNFEYSHQSFLEYEIAVGKRNSKGKSALSLADFHLKCFNRYLKAPKEIPDELLIAKPIWSTWAQYKIDITEEKVNQFVNKIIEYDFPISQLELDDRWTTAYGDFDIDTVKFPSFAEMVEKLLEKKIRLTAWVHPFVNLDSKNGQNPDLKKFFVKGNNTDAGVLTWWDGQGYSIDFTNPKAADWFNEQLRALQSKYKLFSYKFDGGEVSFLPQNFQLFDGTTPNDFGRAYTRNTVAKFGSAVENRIGSDTQDTSVLLRMLDRHSGWNDMGIETIIPTVLVASLHGYFWMLPDMVGGNGYASSASTILLNTIELPSKELFIRWVQVNTFLQAIQFSFGPWNYDDETIEITKTLLRLREEWTPYLIQECKNSVQSKHPVMRPMWWHSDAPEALNATDQFMVGDQLVVAPIVKEAATSRDVFLPPGRWRDGNTDEEFVGPRNVHVKAPLKILPYFVKMDQTSDTRVYYILGFGVLCTAVVVGAAFFVFKRRR